MPATLTPERLFETALVLKLKERVLSAPPIKKDLVISLSDAVPLDAKWVVAAFPIPPAVNAIPPANATTGNAVPRLPTRTSAISTPAPAIAPPIAPYIPAVKMSVLLPVKRLTATVVNALPMNPVIAPSAVKKKVPSVSEN